MASLGRAVRGQSQTLPALKPLQKGGEKKNQHSANVDNDAQVADQNVPGAHEDGQSAQEHTAGQIGKCGSKGRLEEKTGKRPGIKQLDSMAIR